MKKEVLATVLSNDLIKDEGRKMRMEMKAIMTLFVGILYVSTGFTQEFGRSEKTYKLKGANGYSTEEAQSPKSKTGVKFSEAYPEEINTKNFPEVLDTFDYPNVEIKDLVKVMTELTGKRFIVGEGVKGKISIMSPGEISVAEAYKAFLSALQMNNLTVVPSGKFLKIIRSRDAIKDSIETYSGSYFPNSDQMITKIIKLKYIPVKELDKALRSLYSKDGDLKPYEPTNSLIISDYGSNVEKIVGIIKELDVPGFEEKMEVIKIRYAQAKDIADLINKIINKGEKKSRVPRFRRDRDKNKGKGAVSLSYVTADSRTNSVIVLGNKLGVQKARELVKTLDFRLDGDQEGGIHVYYVKHHKAEDLSKTLGGIADSSKKALEKGAKGAGRSSRLPPEAVPKTAAQVFGSEVSVKADKSTNSLIITASAQDYKRVIKILGKIDIPRDQVFVETVIMELNANNQREVGIDIAKITTPGEATPTNPAQSFAVQGMFGNSAENGLGALLANPLAALSGGILSFATGESKHVSINGQTTEVKDIMGLVRLIQTYSIGNVLSTPKLMALDNEEAVLEVGQDIVIGEQLTQGAGGSTTSTQRKNISTTLSITPSISPESNSIRMKIKQTIKDVLNAADPNTPINEKLLETNIVVPNGDTAALGGLVSEKTARTVKKVPLLGDIPILGWLFRSKSKTVVKSNLMIFITPKIIRNAAQNRDLLKGQLDKRLNFIKKNMKGVDPHGEKIDEISKLGSKGATLESSDDVSAGKSFGDWQDETPQDLKEYPAKETL